MEYKRNRRKARSKAIRGYVRAPKGAGNAGPIGTARKGRKLRLGKSRY